MRLRRSRGRSILTRTRSAPGPQPGSPGGPGQGRPFEDAWRGERVVVGSPDTVAAYVEQYATQPGANYFVAAFQWGNITHAQALRSVELFGSEVMPRVGHVAEPTP